jgi:multiple sugar transport system substrate-binding protein
MSKRIKTGTVLALAALVGAGAILGACSRTDGTDERGNGKTTAELKPKEPVELVIQNQNFAWDNDYFMEYYGNDIERKFPHIKLKLLMRGSKIEDTVISGMPLDMIAAPPASFNDTIAKFDLQYDITPLIKKYKYDTNRLDPSVVGLSKQMAGGGIYDIPTSMSPAALVYNKDLFDKFGVAYPKDGMNWDEVFELAKKMTRNEGGVQYRGLFASVGHLINRNQLSLNLINPVTKKADFENGKWKGFLENMARFYQIQGYDMSDKIASLTPQKTEWEKAQTVAMWLPVSGAHLIPDMKNYDYVSFPIFKDFPDVGPQSYPVQFYVTGKSKHKDDAFEVLAYLTSDEFQLKQSKKGVFTVLNNDSIKAAFGQEGSDYTGKNFKALLPKIHAPNMIESKYNTAASAALTTAFYDFVLGKKDINSALREAAEKTNKQIEADQIATGEKK